MSGAGYVPGERHEERGDHGPRRKQRTGRPERARVLPAPGPGDRRALHPLRAPHLPRVHGQRLRRLPVPRVRPRRRPGAERRGRRRYGAPDGRGPAAHHRRGHHDGGPPAAHQGADRDQPRGVPGAARRR
ncbi:hypothetical protein SGPA1_50301 [Streptomyces misionensis JCM 4497]